MIKAAIAGGAGYTAGELIRILSGHPSVGIAYVQSESHAGKPLGDVHTDMLWSELRFSDIDFSDVDVLFLCMGHGYSADFMSRLDIPERVKIIDLGNDFRLEADANGFVYGLPELSRDAIKKADRIANPGCFATSIELGLLPLAAAGALPSEVTVFGVTGSTGAGQKPTQQTHFSNRDNNLSNYKVFTHQHLAEIGETIGRAGAQSDIAFVPVRGCHTRGIISDIVLRTPMGIDELQKMYADYYESHSFVILSEEPISMKQVVNTNYCCLHLEKQDDKLLITSVIDNLVKGASGQAVQNMNLMFGLDEQTGLRLKASYF